MGDVLTITSGVLPAGGGVVGTAAGWRSGSAAAMVFSADAEGVLPAMYGPV